MVIGRNQFTISRATSQADAGLREKGLSSDEVEDLNERGWFCECQDYDEKKFKVRLTAAPVAGQVQARAQAGLWSTLRLIWALASPTTPAASNSRW